MKNALGRSSIKLGGVEKNKMDEIKNKILFYAGGNGDPGNLNEYEDDSFGLDELERNEYLESSESFDPNLDYNPAPSKEKQQEQEMIKDSLLNFATTGVGALIGNDSAVLDLEQEEEEGEDSKDKNVNPFVGEMAKKMNILANQPDLDTLMNQIQSGGASQAGEQQSTSLQPNRKKSSSSKSISFEEKMKEWNKEEDPGLMSDIAVLLNRRLKSQADQEKNGETVYERGRKSIFLGGLQGKDMMDGLSEMEQLKNISGLIEKQT